MFSLYSVMKSRSGLQPPTADEIMYASGQKPFDLAAHALYIDKLEEHTANIKDAFAKQEAAATVGFYSSNCKLILNHLFQLPWDQSKFERLLIEWIVTCDQPFDEVQKPEFISMMEYGRDPKTFSLPMRDGARWRVMKLGDKTIQENTEFFAVCFCFIILR
jgi:hypothetical protein